MSEDVYKSRYSFFKNEIQKWKNDVYQSKTTAKSIFEETGMNNTTDYLKTENEIMTNLD